MKMPLLCSIMGKRGVQGGQTQLQTPRKVQCRVWRWKSANSNTARRPLASCGSTIPSEVLVLAKCVPDPHQEKTSWQHPHDGWNVAHSQESVIYLTIFSAVLNWKYFHDYIRELENKNLSAFIWQFILEKWQCDSSCRLPLHSFT